MKKALPILIVLALIAAVGLGFFMGQQSGAPAKENPPAENTPGEAALAATQEIDLIPYFQQTYDIVWSKPENYNADYGDHTLEFQTMGKIFKQDGITAPPNCAFDYLEWRDKNYPTNAYLLNFSGSYVNTVGNEVMNVYGTPHITLPPIGELHKFDVIDDAQCSDDGVWLKAQYQDRTIYYRVEDLGELTYEEWEYAQEQHKAQSSGNTDYNEGLDGGDWSGDTLPDWILDDPDNHTGESNIIDTSDSEHSTGEGTGAGLIISSGTGGNGNGSGGNPPVETPESDYPPTSSNNSGLPDWATDDPDNTTNDGSTFEDTSNAEHSTGEGTGAGLQING